MGSNHLAGVEVVSFGQVWATPFDTNAVASAGAAFEIVPGLTTFAQEHTPSNTYRFAWQNAALGRDTNALVFAALELFRNGDVSVATNGVTRFVPRVHPSDPDGAGLPSAVDPNPAVCDGDFFGPRNELPPGANTNAYCYVDLVASGADAEVVFTGDGPSDFADPRFMARAGATNHVALLIGKGYEVVADEPIMCVGTSSPEIEVAQAGANSLYVRWPVTVESVAMRGGASFCVSVCPDWLGGGFAWTNNCCSLSPSGWMFTYACNDACHCGGCVAFGYYGYEGYRIPAVGGACGCTGEYDPRPDEEDDGPYAPGASATFTKGAVIFEDGYWNTPTNWVERRSTSTALHCVAHGGPNGGHVRFAIAGEGRLDRVSGHLLPVEQDVGAGKMLDFTIVYEGLSPSGAADDIVVTTTFTENAPGATTTSSQSKLTSVKVELTAVYEAPENVCSNRHVYGVGEKVRFVHYPESIQVSLHADKGDAGDPFTYYDQFDGTINEADKHRIYVCPIAASYTPNPTISYSGVSYAPEISLVEPQSVITSSATWEGCHNSGVVGQSTLVTENYIGPMTVSFRGIMVAEIPCYETNAPSGYFATTNFMGFMTHSADAGAGYAWRIQAGNRWATDRAGGGLYPNWSAGQLQWNVPIGWVRLIEDSQQSGFAVSVQYEIRSNSNSRPLLIGGRSNLYTQTFLIDADGTARIDKFGHWLSRGRYCRIMLDGETKQWTHPLW